MITRNDVETFKTKTNLIIDSISKTKSLPKSLEFFKLQDQFAIFLFNKFKEEEILDLLSEKRQFYNSILTTTTIERTLLKEWVTLISYIFIQNSVLEFKGENGKTKKQKKKKIQQPKLSPSNNQSKHLYVLSSNWKEYFEKVGKTSFPNFRKHILTDEQKNNRCRKAIGMLSYLIFSELKNGVHSRSQITESTGFNKQRICVVLSIFKGSGILIVRKEKSHELNFRTKTVGAFPFLTQYNKKVISLRYKRRQICEKGKTLLNILKERLNSETKRKNGHKKLELRLVRRLELAFQKREKYTCDVITKKCIHKNKILRLKKSNFIQGKSTKKRKTKIMKKNIIIKNRKRTKKYNQTKHPNPSDGKSQLNNDQDSKNKNKTFYNNKYNDNSTNNYNNNNNNNFNFGIGFKKENSQLLKSTNSTIKANSEKRIKNSSEQENQYQKNIKSKANKIKSEHTFNLNNNENSLINQNIFININNSNGVHKEKEKEKEKEKKNIEEKEHQNSKININLNYNFNQNQNINQNQGQTHIQNQIQTQKNQKGTFLQSHAYPKFPTPNLLKMSTQQSSLTPSFYYGDYHKFETTSQSPFFLNNSPNTFLRSISPQGLFNSCSPNFDNLNLQISTSPTLQMPETWEQILKEWKENQISRMSTNIQSLQQQQLQFQQFQQMQQQKFQQQQYQQFQQFQQYQHFQQLQKKQQDQNLSKQQNVLSQNPQLKKIKDQFEYNSQYSNNNNFNNQLSDKNLLERIIIQQKIEEVGDKTKQQQQQHHHHHQQQQQLKFQQTVHEPDDDQDNLNQIEPKFIPNLTDKWFND
ncbi:protein mtl1-related [Anaeramoeba flamelloides]|uniref:Protein mtl1-related n=1 Tax=Anaeramoeba flamelloides TaxID=1746091 RepID=A0AAV7ZQH2_9EUKA|nr:protein mtl1-related [Anaeramoeba flamelloides]